MGPDRDKNDEEVIFYVCGFAGVFGDGDGESDLTKVQMMLDRISHRGPDDRGTFRGEAVSLGQHGLAVIDVESKRQPLGDSTGGLWIVSDVEAYGLDAMRKRYEDEHSLATGTAAEVILHMYDEMGPACVEHIDGAFAFALYDRRNDALFIARDELGVKPLYYGYDAAGALCFASEIKALLAATDDVREFPPGHYYDSRHGFTEYFRLPAPDGDVAEADTVDDAEEAVEQIHSTLKRAVHKRLATDVPLGTFLSGGLDSSLIAAMAVRRRDNLPSFAVGMEGSADLAAARIVAEHLGTDHYEHVITPGEIRAVLPRAIYYLESFDPALVRGAMANYFAARLASEHVKVVLAGEGADELFSGYEYLKDLDIEGELPQELHFITETMRNSGLQRLDRLTAAHSLASRPPFLDTEVVTLAFRISPRLKLYGDDKVEKWVLRKVAEHYLPADIIWRGKEKFAAGTGTADVLRRLAERHVGGAEYEAGRFLADGFEIKSREEYYYYKIFRRFFPAHKITRFMGRSRSLDATQRYA